MKYHLVVEPYERYGNATVYYKTVEAESRVDAILNADVVYFDEDNYYTDDDGNKETKLDFLKRLGSLELDENSNWAYWVSDDGETVSVGETKEEAAVNFVNMLTRFGGTR